MDPKKKHNHLFIHTGGGCRLGAARIDMTDKHCDDEFKCRCGKKEIIWTTYENHFRLPKKMGINRIKEMLKKEVERIPTENHSCIEDYKSEVLKILK